MSDNQKMKTEIPVRWSAEAVTAPDKDKDISAWGAPITFDDPATLRTHYERIEIWGHDPDELLPLRQRIIDLLNNEHRVELPRLQYMAELLIANGFRLFVNYDDGEEDEVVTPENIFEKVTAVDECWVYARHTELSGGSVFVIAENGPEWISDWAFAEGSVFDQIMNHVSELIEKDQEDWGFIRPRENRNA